MASRTVAQRRRSVGADYQLIVGDIALDALYGLETDDNELIIVRSRGVLGALVPTFETRSAGPYAWPTECGGCRAARTVVGAEGV